MTTKGSLRGSMAQQELVQRHTFVQHFAISYFMYLVYRGRSFLERSDASFLLSKLCGTLK